MVRRKSLCLCLKLNYKNYKLLLTEIVALNAYPANEKNQSMFSKLKTATNTLYKKKDSYNIQPKLQQNRVSDDRQQLQ